MTALRTVLLVLLATALLAGGAAGVSAQDAAGEDEAQGDGDEAPEGEDPDEEDEPWPDEDDGSSVGEGEPDPRPTPPARRVEDDDEAEDEEDEEDAEDDEDDDEEEENADPDLGGATTTFVPADDAEEGEDDSTLIIPPLFMRTTRGDATTTAVFPLFFEKEAPDDVQRMILLYYYRRSLEQNSDILFPFYWSLRGVDSLTFSIPPVYYHYDENGYDWGVAPFVFNGRSDDHVYTIIPPLLTFSYANDEEAYTLATIFWRYREREAVRWGIFPLIWDLAEITHRDTMAIPFFFRFADHETENVLTVVPPVYHEEDPNHALFGVAPLFHHYHDDEGASLTLPPLLFHYGNFNGDVRLINPLFAWFDVEDERTFLTWVYQRHRGQTELDSVAPLVFSYRDPRESFASLVITPFLWHFSGPSATNTVVFPFVGYFHEPGLYTTWASLLAVHNRRHDEDRGFTWVFPTLDLRHDPEQNVANFHPIVYSRNEEEYRHLVIAPIHWDFEWRDEDYRATVDFPIFWRFRSGSEVKQVLLNTYYREYREDGADGWEFHFFPLFAFGKPRPGDHWWNILYGLAGYRRQGSYAQTQLLWIPFQTDGPSGPE